MHGQTANLSLKGSPYWMAPEVGETKLIVDCMFGYVFRLRLIYRIDEYKVQELYGLSTYLW